MEVMSLREELQMYKPQQEKAQSEINKAQTVLEEVEHQCNDAETSTAGARIWLGKLMWRGWWSRLWSRGGD